MQIATISSKNQITLPVSILRSLGLSPSRKVLVKKEDESIVITPVKKDMIEELSGSLNKYISKDKLGKSVKEVEDIAKERAAFEIAKKMLQE